MARAGTTSSGGPSANQPRCFGMMKQTPPAAPPAAGLRAGMLNTWADWGILAKSPRAAGLS
eukprot:4115432-Lingulodinium_polyedra.AAC.1